MNNAETVSAFIEYDLSRGYIIEPSQRNEKVKERLLKAVKNQSPSIAVKNGIGEGDIALALAEKVKKLIVVDPSYAALARFKEKYGAQKAAKNIELINGLVSALPVDYFKADMAVCIDYLDLVDSYRSIDEIRRALRFEGTFFFGGVVLHNEDVEGLYDEFIHSVHPLHNDYYLEGDLDTFMKLKDFTKIDEHVETFPLDAAQYIEYWRTYPQRSDTFSADASMKILADNAAVFSSLYSFNGKSAMKERYMTALFRKNEYKQE